ncbi:ribose transport system ATP-binding protein/rhamnose transport system ATP-binding protein [Aquamicrobium terrae]
MKPLISLARISKSFPGVRALDEVDLDIYPGEIHALIGENGAGKSTLLKILFGVLQPNGGEILVKGEPAIFQNPRDSQRHGIAMVHQELSVIPSLSLGENIMLGREQQRWGFIDRRRLHAEAAEALAKLNFTVDTRRKAFSFSIAEQQIAEIARALQFDTPILVLDEPTASLSFEETERLLELVTALRASGHGIVYVSHRLQEFKALKPDRVTVLRDGRRVSESTAPDRYEEANLVRLMVGRSVDTSTKASRPAGDVMLELRGLTSAGRFRAVDLSVRAGEIVGLAGMIGAGRTELARAVVGADRIDSGTILVKGRPITYRSAADAIRDGVFLVPEDRKGQGLALNLTIDENVVLPRPETFAGFLNRSAQRRSASVQLDRLSVKVPGHFLVRKLSGGNQQKVVLAKWLRLNASVLVVDEPTRGIDIGAREQIYRLLRELADTGLAILMISSDMPEVIRLSDRVLVMARGRIEAELEGDGITEEAIVAAATGKAGRGGKHSREYAS